MGQIILTELGSQPVKIVNSTASSNQIAVESSVSTGIQVQPANTNLQGVVGQILLTDNSGSRVIVQQPAQINPVYISSPGPQGPPGTSSNQEDKYTFTLSSTDSDYHYFGGLNVSGEWKINRFDRSNNLLQSSADRVGNTRYLSLSEAWEVRSDLVYEEV